MPVNRNRRRYFFLVLATIGIGLASRSRFVPELIYPYLGDVLYALMIYFLIGFLFPRISALQVVLISILICFAIEISQLYQADWILEIRRTKLGGLILGFGFLWRDLICYLIGGMAGFGLERLFLNSSKSS